MNQPSPKTPARYTVAGITDERDTCDCCGKTGLKRVVVLLDLDSREYVFFGTTCAARNTGDRTIAATAQQRGKAPSPQRAEIEYYKRLANSCNRRAESIMRGPGVSADELTRAEARKWWEDGAAALQKARELQAAL